MVIDLGSARTQGTMIHIEILQLLAVDILALATMKNAAKRDSWCDLQVS